ncbi:MAG: FliM/FliN family flagellar motor switch protein [Solirubrobacteraceae bacterium]
MSSSYAEAQLHLAQATSRAVADVLTGLGVTVEVGKPALAPRGSNPLEILPMPGVMSKVAYIGGVAGGNVIATSVAGANVIAAAMGAGNDLAATELSDIAQSAFSEAANQMLASASAATAAVLGRGVEVDPPETTVLESIPDVNDVATPHVTRVSLTVAGETCLFVQLVPQSFVMRVSAALEESETFVFDDDDLDGPMLDSGWVHETPLRLDAELGSARLTADEVLGLRDGAVVVLDRAVDDPVELYVNGTPYGAGRLLLDGDEWAVMIEEILPQGDQLESEANETVNDDRVLDSVEESIEVDTEGSG